MEDADSGSSLIEAIVGLSIIALILVGVVDATWTSARLASAARTNTVSSALLASSARTLYGATYSPCPHIDGSYASGLDAPVAITKYEYWAESTARWVDLASINSQQCLTNTDLTGTFALQRLTLTESISSGTTRSLSIVKTRVPRS